MTTRIQTADDALLARYMEGELGTLEAASLERELTDSLDARLRLEQLREIRAALAAPLTTLEGVDLTGRVSAALTKHPPRRSYAWMMASAAAAAVCIGLGSAWSLHSFDGPVGLRAKAASNSSGQLEARAAFDAYRVRDGGPAEATSALLAKSDSLLFAYTNVGARPYRYLMLFGVDASRQVRWFYPAYERAGSDPQSIAIAPDQFQTLLPDVIRHDYAVGELTLYALFTRTPLRVSDVERQLAEHPQPALPDALLRSRKLEVSP